MNWKEESGSWKLNVKRSKRENDEDKLKELNTTIANLAVERDTLKAKWQRRKRTG